MTTEAQKRAHQKLAAAREAAGKKPKTVWLTEAARAKLAALAKVHGSEEKALETLLAKATSVMPIQPAEERTERQPPAPKLAVAPRGTSSPTSGIELPLGNIRRVTPKGEKSKR